MDNMARCHTICLKDTYIVPYQNNLDRATLGREQNQLDYLYQSIGTVF